MWNKRKLERPARNCIKCPATDLLNINQLATILLEAKKYFNNKTFINFETELLSTTIYRMKQKFRNYKEVKSFEKIQQCLKRYFELEYSEDLHYFTELLPTRLECGSLYLPNKNVLEFLLVRLQSISCLLVRVVETCKIAAFTIKQRISIGHFWQLALICLGIVSRIFVVAKSIINYSCDLYSKLFVFLAKLPGNVQWLPQDYKIPKDLKLWLNIDWLDQQEVIEIEDIPNIVNFFNLEDSDDEVEISDEYIMLDDDLTRKKNDFENVTLRGFNIEDDVGNVIDLELEQSYKVPPKAIDLCGEELPKKSIALPAFLNKIKFENTSFLGRLKNELQDIGNPITSKKKRKKKKNLGENNKTTNNLSTIDLTVNQTITLNKVKVKPAQNEVNMTKLNTKKKTRKKAKSIPASSSTITASSTKFPILLTEQRKAVKNTPSQKVKVTKKQKLASLKVLSSVVPDRKKKKRKLNSDGTSQIAKKKVKRKT